MAPLKSSQEEENESAISWLWETFWLGITLFILNILASGQCLSIALDKKFLTAPIILMMGAWLFLFTLLFWFLITRIRQGKMWPIYLIVANGIISIISLILFLVLPRDSAQYGPSITDFTRNFNLSPSEAKIAIERFQTCAGGSHMTFVEYLSRLISAGLVAWMLYAAFILMNNLRKNGQTE